MVNTCVSLQRTLDCKKKPSTSPTRRERPLIKKTGWSTTERETDGHKERERGREDTNQIDVDNVETTYFDNCDFFAAFASFLLQYVLSRPYQSCFSRIMCTLLHYPLWCVHCFTMFNCWCYPSQHRYAILTFVL